MKLEMKETVKPYKLYELADTLEEQQKKEADEMELTQSNPGLSEEDLDGDDDDVMEVFPDKSAKGVTNLEEDEEVMTMQDIDGFILSQPGGSQVHYMRGNNLVDRVLWWYRRPYLCIVVRLKSALFSCK